MRIILSLCLIVCTTIQVSAQQYVTTGDFDRISKASFGIGLNTYFGELRRATDPKLQTGLSATIGYEHLFTDQIAIRTGLSIYKIQADDSLSPLPDNKVRNLNFKATNFELVVQAMYYAFRHPASGYKDRAFANPYIHLGIGVTSNNPKAELAGTTYDLRPLSLEGVQYGGLALAIPMGFGFNFYLSRNFDLQMEVQYTMAMTGYLDDVNSVYRDPASFSETDGVDATTLGLLSDPRAALSPPVEPVPAGTIRGDGTNDSYLRFGFRLAYYLPKSLYGKSSIRCKVVKRTR
ncbi:MULTISPECIES: hypothetical protein [Roseivirga]|jgi:hypothetical protein|uniref:hypothetical protein n=1 Tax=Roseivirga TaxID=290180 RepID=UPI000D794E07|nr:MULTISPECIES: hypothetical protein [Roseivirga]PWL32305.1 MAG: hypothetical protein DCO95_03760 [Roseivirga sp. XM-24bin3]MBO6495351.1 hypothetical protein [Roseivirga sp.]MBO6660470.1 hypothetical protein [Roseivirga sp.]MBO6761384.1 hypothetical protein [Roseivirga sp.]MBO6906793.1 hypothetical protein [Roseivirga sp.]